MHRSGTSAATRALNLCGLALPDDLLAPAPDNPDGYWEPFGVVALHDELLQAAGLDWRDPRPFPRAWFETERAGQFRYRLWQAIRPALTGPGLLLIKDPRLCRLVPLWRRLCLDCGLGLHCVVVARNPLDVAASLARRDAMPLAEALLLWLRHMIEAERATRGLPRGFMLYDQLMREGAAAVRRVAARADIPLPPATGQTDAAVAAVLDQRHWHHRTDRAALAAAPLVPDWVTATYDWLVRAASQDAEPGADALNAVHAAMHAADLLYAPAIGGPRSAGEDLPQRLDAAEAMVRSLDQRIAVQQEASQAAQARIAAELVRSRQDGDALRNRHAALLEERQALAATLVALRASRSWRLTAPLRWVGRVLRGRG